MGSVWSGRDEGVGGEEDEVLGEEAVVGGGG